MAETRQEKGIFTVSLQTVQSDHSLNCLPFTRSFQEPMFQPATLTLTAVVSLGQ